ncbi:hypothetical protein GH714_043798 [Hevea brasiliensis]|uniref:Uncharacterized protein n=1 Tax=Hevea brasiliensis TaxID=3981 RepID=A0A6A6K5G6_HEVBR|nr:hypothetical protein GH714_043798 [Hevea brasiliensis]
MDVEWLLEFLRGMIKPAAALAVVLMAVSVAGYTAGQRAKHVPRGKYVAGASILAGTAVTMFVLVILNVFPFTPRYIIPVAGMMVGNAMTVTGVTMKRLRDDIKVQMSLVETALALGATPRQATLQQVKRALVIALSPVLDNAKTVGLISLPGAMTGLIMGGASPLEAIQLQIVPLTEFTSKKCKRCGFYEEDKLKSDDVFDEWEFCPSDFVDSDGKYRRIKDKEFDATFLCPQCVPLAADALDTFAEYLNQAVVLSLVECSSTGKKKREQEQARFLKLFEDGDDIEDELGLGTVI